MVGEGLGGLGVAGSLNRLVVRWLTALQAIQLHPKKRLIFWPWFLAAGARPPNRRLPMLPMVALPGSHAD